MDAGWIHDLAQERLLASDDTELSLKVLFWTTPETRGVTLLLH